MRLTHSIPKIGLTVTLGLSMAIPTQAAIANQQTGTPNPIQTTNSRSYQLAQLKQKPTSAAATKAERIEKTMATLQKSQQRWIQVDLSDQQLIAWEGNKLVYRMTVSTGKRSTPTLTGTFNIQTKLPKARMQGDDYDVANVPHVMFYDGNYAIHGAYWHSNFGTPVSHGCVNLTPKKARLLFNWAKVGTPVVVHK